MKIRWVVVVKAMPMRSIKGRQALGSCLVDVEFVECPNCP